MPTAVKKDEAVANTLFAKILTKREAKKRKGFSGDEHEVIVHSVDKDYFKDNYEDYDTLKKVSKSLKEWNENSIAYAATKIASELNDGNDQAEVVVPNGVSAYDKIIVRGRKAKTPEGEDTVKLSYKVNSVSIFPGKTRMKTEKDKLLAAVVG